MNKIIFLDIDGPMIPGRAYFLPNQKKAEGLEGFAGVVTEFDPCAVSILNQVCKERGWKIVIHSSWIRIAGGQTTLDHCVRQGILAENFHEDAICDEEENWRYTRVAKWLKEHPEVTSYVILDDEPYQADVYSEYPHPSKIKRHLMLIDFNEGLLMKHYRSIRDEDWYYERSS